MFTMVILSPVRTKCDLVSSRLFFHAESPQNSFPFNHGDFPSSNNRTASDSFFQRSDFTTNHHAPSRFPSTFAFRAFSNPHKNTFLFLPRFANLQCLPVNPPSPSR